MASSWIERPSVRHVCDSVRQGIINSDNINSDINSSSVNSGGADSAWCPPKQAGHWAARDKQGSVRLWRLLGCLALLLAATAWASPCEQLDREGATLELAGFGMAFFGDLRFEAATDSADISGGLCFISEARQNGEPLWIIEAQAMRAEALSTDPRFVVEQARLRVQGWWLESRVLRSTAQGFRLEDIRFRNHSPETNGQAIFDEQAVPNGQTRFEDIPALETNLRLSDNDVIGQAAQAEYNTLRQELVLEQVALRSARYRVSGARALLRAEQLRFEDALATTCICDGGELYVVTTPQADFDLLRDVLQVNDGVLRIAGVEIRLAEQLELSEASLADITIPLQIEYVSDTEADDGRVTRGTGLGIVLQPLRLPDGALLEVGLRGIDRDYPLRGVLLLRLEQPGLALTFGSPGEGFQADFRRQQALLPWLDVDFGINVRAWLAQDFLRQTFVGLRGQQQWQQLLGDDVNDALQLELYSFAALSNQTVNDIAITSPRLGLQASGNYQSPTTALGRFRLDMQSSAIHYPSYSSSQYALRFRPQWEGVLGTWRTRLNYDVQWSNAASPFSDRLDRQEPRSRLQVDSLFRHSNATRTASFSGRVLGEYDFLASEARNPWRQLLLQAQADIDQGAFRLRPHFSAEFARLLREVPDRQVDAYLEAGLDVDIGAWELGLLSRYNLRPLPAERDWDRLELSLQFPLEFPRVSLRPYLALDFAPTAIAGDLPSVVGYGLEAKVDTCCGVVVASFRQYNNNVSTGVSLQLGN